MLQDFTDARAEIDDCLRREREARDAASASDDASTRDMYVMTAERLADRAWSLTEESDGPFIPSGLWRSDSVADASPD